MKTGILDIQGTQSQNPVLSSATNLDLGASSINSFYYYTGSSNTSWTLPTVGNWTHKYILIKNRTSPLKILTINTASGNGSIIRGQGISPTSSITLSGGSAVLLQSDGTNVNIKGIWSAP